MIQHLGVRYKRAPFLCLFDAYKKGTATEEEQQAFDIAIKTACMDEQFLMNLINEKEKTIE